MRQLSNSTSLVSLARIPSLSSFLPGAIPGVPFSTMKAEMPLVPAARSVTAITTMMSPTRPCVVNVFDPLSTQQSPARAARGAHAGGVAARRRFGQPPRANLLAARQRHQELLLLRFGAEQEDVRRSRGRCAPPPTARRRDRPARAPRCRCSSRWPTSPAPPYCSGNWMPEQAERGQLRHQLGRKMLRLVPLADVRPDFGFGELAHAAAQQRLLFGRTEIHRMDSIRQSKRQSAASAAGSGNSICGPLQSLPGSDQSVCGARFSTSQPYSRPE